MSDRSESVEMSSLVSVGLLTKVMSCISNAIILISNLINAETRKNLWRGYSRGKGGREYDNMIVG